MSLLVSNKAIETGQKPKDCANDIFRALLRGDNEVLPLKYIGGIWIRSLLPSLFFRLMNKRARTFEARNKVAHIV